MKSLRRYSESDIHELLSWRNHPETRRWSFSSQVIAFAEHEAWFHRFLSNPHKLGLMLLDEGKPVAQIRFEPTSVSGTVTISISVNPAALGKGFGKQILALSLDHPDVLRMAAMARAETFLDNIPSQKIFAATGFREIARGTREGKEFIEWRRPLGDKLARLHFGCVGYGPLLDTALESFAIWGYSPDVVVRIDPAAAPRADFVEMLEQRSATSAARFLLVFDWTVPAEIRHRLPEVFPAGAALFRTPAMQNGPTGCSAPDGYCTSDVTTETCLIHLWDHVARLAQESADGESEKP